MSAVLHGNDVHGERLINKLFLRGFPGLQTVFNQFLTPSAPADMFAAMGKNGQIINVVPGKGLVVIRMGDAPDTASVPLSFQENLWKELNKVIR